MIKKNLWVLLISVLSFPVSAQDYLWPTDASPHMTSAFGEARPRRFHAAIDVKTWNQVGYKTFAVRNGYIERMAISPFGYGRVLYLRLDTGETAVYAHLEKFNDKLQALAEQEQERAGRYRFDKHFAPGTLPIQKGKVIGYTGQSGIGVPHLHFELRDARGRPLNPFLRGFKIVDHLPPTITDFAISPLASDAMINGDFQPVTLRPTRANGKWRIAETMQISGKVGVAVDAYDQADGAENKFGVYRLQLFVDDSLQFQTQYDRFDYGQNKYIELDRDFLLKRRGLGDFYRLYRVAGNALGFYSHLNHAEGALQSLPEQPEFTTSGILEKIMSLRPFQALPGLKWGEHQLRIVAGDFAGNESVLEVELLVGPPFAITPKILDRQPTRLQIAAVVAPAMRQIQRLEISAANANGRSIISPWRPLTARWKRLGKLPPFVSASGNDSLSDTVNGVTASQQPSVVDSVLEIQTGGAQIIRFVAVDQNNLRSHPAYLFNPPAQKISPPMLLAVEKDFYPNHLRLLIRANQPLASAPAIKFSNGHTILQIQSLPQQPHRYMASIPLAAIAGDSMQLEVIAENMFGQLEVWQEGFMNALVQPGWGRSLFAPDARMRVSFSEDSVYWPLYGRVRVDTVTHIGDARVIGPIYHVEPQDVPLNESAVVTISYPDSITQPRQLGVGYRDRKGWTFIDNNLNIANRTISARVLSLEDFAIILDEEPPILQIHAPRPNAVLQNHRPQISVEVKDSTSGFASEQSLALRLDGQLVIAEYDPERDVVQYKPKRDLAPGAHKLSVRAEDRCGNVAQREVEFTVR